MVRRTTYVGAADDPAEREADDVADRIVDSLRDATGFAGADGSTRVRRFGGDAPVVRRLVSGASLRGELGGPSRASKTYRTLLDDLDAYQAYAGRPLRVADDNDGLQNDAKYLDGLVRRVIESCEAFLAGHETGRRAPRVAQIKADALRERAALRMRAAEVKRGAKPTWATWNEGISTTSETTTRDLDAERALDIGTTGGAMNVDAVSKIRSPTGGVKIGDRTPTSFFKAEKAKVNEMEKAFAQPIGIPIGEGHGDSTEQDRSGPRFARRAVATSRIDKLLNANVIAMTQLAVRNSPDGKVEGQLMQKADGAQAGSLGADAIDDPELQRLLSRLDLVDSLCGQIDRHRGNYFVDRDKATGRVTKVTGIDNDMTFGTKNFTAGQPGADSNEYGGIGRYIDQEVGEAILALTPADLRAVLGDLLLADEIEAAVERLVATQAVVREAQADGRLIGPAGWGANTVGAGGVQYGIRQNAGYHANQFHAG